MFVIAFINIRYKLEILNYFLSQPLDYRSVLFPKEK